MNGSCLTKQGFNYILNRAFTPSPSLTAPTKFRIGTGTATPATTDTGLATPIYFDTPTNTVTYKSYVTGYPTFDTANQKVTTQGFIASTEGNSTTITEIGEYNTDGTPILFMRTVFTGITKTASVQIFWTTVYRRG